MKLQHLLLLIFILFISLFHLNGGNRTIDWDVIVFTQQWVLTYCHVWRSRDESRKCNLETMMPGNYWKVHGIWPTKFGTPGPIGCRPVNFTIDRLQPEAYHFLEKMWTHIAINEASENFWKSEWTKHGSCSTEIQQLDDQYKYLTQAMDWWRDYRLHEILANEGIVPGYEYPHGNITGAIQRYTKKGVQIRCFYDEHTKTSFIYEILICFDKNLTLIDCNLKQNLNKRDCGKEWDLVTYPDSVPPLHSDSGAERGKLISSTLFCFIIGVFCMNKFN